MTNSTQAGGDKRDFGAAILVIYCPTLIHTGLGARQSVGQTGSMRDMIITP